MDLIPKYSLEFNKILNPSFSEIEQIQNFSSLISDKDRFFLYARKLQDQLPYFEKNFGFPFSNTYIFYVVRGERFKSFSEPITVEYSPEPLEMIMFLLKEILKVSITERFLDEIQREQFVNAFVKYSLGTFLTDLEFNFELLDLESQKLFPEYIKKEINFENKNFKELMEFEIEEALK